MRVLPRLASAGTRARCFTRHPLVTMEQGTVELIEHLQRNPA
jgi:hypothetical protein